MEVWAPKIKLVTTGVAGSGSSFVRGCKALSLLACLLLRVAVMGQHQKEAYGQTFHFLYPKKDNISFSCARKEF
jgi:hypothetical protein